MLQHCHILFFLLSLQIQVLYPLRPLFPSPILNVLFPPSCPLLSSPKLKSPQQIPPFVTLDYKEPPPNQKSPSSTPTSFHPETFHHLQILNSSFSLLSPRSCLIVDKGVKKNVELHDTSSHIHQANNIRLYQP